MNRYESSYRKGTRALVTLLAIWVGSMLLVIALPARVQKSDLTWIGIAVWFVGLFALGTVLSIVTMVSYMRWTGKYPYYLLFRKSPDTGHRSEKEMDGNGGANKG